MKSNGKFKILLVRRIIVFCGISIGSILLTGCNKRELEDLRQENSELQERVDELEAKLEDAKGKAGDLEDEVSRFDYENWRDVVPDVESASEDVSSALE